MKSINIKGINIYYDNISVASKSSKHDVIALLKHQLISEIEDGRYNDIYFYINLLDIANRNYSQIINPFYMDIVKELFENKTLFYINNDGLVCSGKNICDCDFVKWNLSTSAKSLKRLIAINHLSNIAEYYNNVSKFDHVYYYIEYDKIHDDYYIQEKHDSVTGMPFFYRKIDAEHVKNNPNFKPILKRIFK